MRSVDGIRVTASLHAAERSKTRAPVTNGADLSAASWWVEGLCARAIRDGRKAKRCPPWCIRDDEVGLRRRARARSDKGTMRFVWNEDETFAALVVSKSDDDGQFWLVVTVLARNVVPV